MRAYIDESCREQLPGVFVLAAVVVPTPRADQVRAQVRGHALASGARFHWHAEGSDRRVKFLEELAGFSLPAVVAVAAPIDPQRQERARRKCLEQLLWELVQRDVRDLVLESRQERRDRHDRAAILAGQKAGQVPADLRYAFEQPSREPLLWLPDVVAGVVSAVRAGLPGLSLAALGPSVSLVEAGDAT